MKPVMPQITGGRYWLYVVARYQHDFAGVSSRTLSQRYYYQALTLCPEFGEQFCAVC